MIKKRIMSCWSRIGRWIRLTLGIAVVPEVCEASQGDKDYHDYQTSKGGNGHPDHFAKQQCWNCGKKFTI